jgi:hypothetical protein
LTGEFFLMMKMKYFKINALLSNGLDPSQYTFDQISLRSSFQKFLDVDAFRQFTYIHNPCLVEYNEITMIGVISGKNDSQILSSNLKLIATKRSNLISFYNFV